MTDLSAITPLIQPGEALRDWRGVSFLEFTSSIPGPDGKALRQGPGQLAITLVAYDGLQPCELPPKLRELARDIFGDIERFPDEARRVFVAVAGARGGKTYIMSALRALHLALTVALDNLAPGERAYAAIVAPNPQQRDQCYSFMLGAARSDALKRHIVGEPGGDSFVLRRADGKEVVVEAIPAKRGGGALRGRWHVCVVLEECAFFQDANYVVNDRDLFDAAAPRILPGGQLIMPSTPWLESGVLYEEFVANHPEPWRAAPHLRQPGRPTRAIAAHAPTLLLFPSPLNQQVVQDQTARDPVNARREYGAQFLGLGSTQYFDAGSLAESIDPMLTAGHPPSGDELSLVVLGVDLGFRHDAAAAVVVERGPDGYRLLGYLELFAAAEGLKPSDVLTRFSDFASQFGVSTVVGDQHYAEAAREYFTDLGWVWAEIPGGATGKAEIYESARRAVAERSVKLPNDQRLLQQFRDVKKRPLPGGGISIEQPRKPAGHGGHGDVASAAVAAIWWLSTVPLPEPVTRIGQERQVWRDALRQIDAEKKDAWGAIAQRIGRRR